MPGLEDIREELYKKDAKEPAPAARGSLPLRRRKNANIKPSWDVPPPGGNFDPMAKSYSSQGGGRRAVFKIGLSIGFILVVGLASFAVYKIISTDNRLDFSIIGPDRITAGESVVLIARVINKSNVVFRNSFMEITLPDGSFYTDGGNVSTASPRRKLEVGELRPGAEFNKEIQVRILGAAGESRVIAGEFVYRPENVETDLAESVEFKVSIVRVPVAVTVDAPERVSSGQEVSFVIGVDSELSAPLGDMALGVDFPPGFKLTSSDPPAGPGADNIWPLGNLESGTSRKITVRGSLRGNPEEVKAFRIRVGRYTLSNQSWLVIAETTAGPTIASPFLFAQTSLGGARSGSLAPGSRVNGNVFFKNNLKQKIQNVFIEVSFPEKFVELESVRAEKGFYDVTKKAIVWNPSSEARLRELDPSEEGTLVFSFQLKDNLPIRSFGDKNFVLSVLTAIDSAAPPPEYRGVSLKFQDSGEFKIESRLRLSARVGYYDSPVANAGPLPPKVRQTTTYAVYFKLSSEASDLRDVEVRAELAGGVEWKASLASDSGEIAFNPASHEVVWRVPKLPAATGVLRSPAAAAFQISFTPADNQVNTSPTIVKAIGASGIDVFSDAAQSDTENDLTTELRTDSRSKFEEWRVVR